MSYLDTAMTNLEEKIRGAIRKVSPFRAIVASVNGDDVTIKRLEAQTAESEVRAHLYQPTLAVNDEVLCLPVHGKPVILGKVGGWGGGGGGAATWGAITGTLSSQTDLQNALNGKADSARGLPSGGSTGQVLTKSSGTNYAVGWTTPASPASPVFDTRDYATVQATIDAASSAGGGVVFLGSNPAGRMTLTLKDGVYLVGRGPGASRLLVNAISGTGALGSALSLSSAVAAGARSVTFTTSGHGLSAGDVFIIYDSTNSSFNNARTVYRAGEFCRVASVSGATVTLTAPTYAAYSTGTNRRAYKVNPIRTGISGMTIQGASGYTAIKIALGADLVFRDLDLSGSNNSHLTLERCYNATISDVTAFDASAISSPDALNYGITLANSQRIRIGHVDLETRRHGLTMGGSDVTGAVPCRDIRISDSYIGGFDTSTGVCGLNLHGNCEDIHIDHCTLPSGFNASGNNVTVRNCDIGQAPWGGAIFGGELLGLSHVYEHNVFRITMNYPSVNGAIYLPFGSSTRVGSGILRFSHNLIDTGSYGGNGAAHYLTRVIIADAGVPGSNILIANDNVFRTSQAIGSEHQSIRVDGSSAAGFTEVLYRDNIGNLPVKVQGSSPQPRWEGTGAGAPAFAAQPGSRYLRTDGGASTSLYIKESIATSGTWRAV